MHRKIKALIILSILIATLVVVAVPAQPTLAGTAGQQLGIWAWPWSGRVRVYGPNHDGINQEWYGWVNARGYAQTNGWWWDGPVQVTVMSVVAKRTCYVNVPHSQKGDVYTITCQ